MPVRDAKVQGVLVVMTRSAAQLRRSADVMAITPVEVGWAEIVVLYGDKGLSRRYICIW